MNTSIRNQIQAHIDTAQWSEALIELDAVPRALRDIQWTAMRAEAEAGAGNADGAADLYAQLLTQGCDDPTVLYNASVALSDVEDHGRAVVALECLIEVEGLQSSVLNDLAFEYNESGFYVPALLAANEAERLSVGEEQKCFARLNAATALANMRRLPDARVRLDGMLSECTGACGERETALELRNSLAKRASSIRPPVV